MTTLYKTTLFLTLLLLTSASPAEETTPLNNHLLSARTATCSQSQCTACSNECPDAAVLAKIYWDCYKHRTFYYTSSDDRDIEEECKRQPCLQYLAPRACNVIPHSEHEDILDEMQREIDSITTQLQELQAERREVLRRGNENKEALQYYAKYVPEENKCHELFSNALKVRAINAKNKLLMESVEFRSQKREMERLSSESDNLRKHVRYWEYQNESLSNAVKSSPLQLVNARNELLSNLEAFKEDAKLVEILRSSSTTKENQYSLLTTLKGKLRAELAALRSTNAHLRYELAFIKAARMEIYRFLSSVLYQIAKGKLSVECGGSALGKVASNFLLD